MSEPPARPVGLRERKKARTRAAIREHALALFREQGYYATTIEQIADAAEVSPATFFRYFPTKEDVVLQDDFDVISLGALADQPPELGPIAAFRAAAATTFAALSAADRARFRETMELTAAIPEIRARAIDEFVRTINQIAEAIALRAGRSADEFEARTIAGAIIGVVMSATAPGSTDTWNVEGMSDVADVFARIDRGLEYLERGLPL
ncbi:MAG TPA: TetR family transcriptional regulator [Streptosporangiaceae bacterium]|nr:TetR family transcriptional regulator [Streptosporangiaceae bacterium]